MSRAGAAVTALAAARLDRGPSTIRTAMLLLSIFLYAGLTVLLASAIGLVKPVRWIGLATRQRAAMVAIGGMGLVVIACAWPTPVIRAAGVHSMLDEHIRAYQFAEYHETHVHAMPAKVFEAIRQVTAPEIRYFGLLTSIRNPRFGKAEESILAAPADKPILAVALKGGFRVLGERPSEEMVIGVRVAPDVRGVMNFKVSPDADGWVRLSTETRVFAATPAALRGFTVYWRLIYPGSALIRIEWLRAIKNRAERT